MLVVCGFAFVALLSFAGAQWLVEKTHDGQKRRSRTQDARLFLSRMAVALQLCATASSATIYSYHPADQQRQMNVALFCSLRLLWTVLVVYLRFAGIHTEHRLVVLTITASFYINLRPQVCTAGLAEAH